MAHVFNYLIYLSIQVNNRISVVSRTPCIVLLYPLLILENRNYIFSVFQAKNLRFI